MGGTIHPKAAEAIASAAKGQACNTCKHYSTRAGMRGPCRQCIGLDGLPKYEPAPGSCPPVTDGLFTHGFEVTPTSTPSQCGGCKWPDKATSCCQESTAYLVNPATGESTPVDTPTRGLRYNKGKRRFDLIPPDTLALLADLLTRGAEKYAERNWELGMPYSDALGSLERHLQDWKAGIDLDDETKMNHMIHVMCNAMFLATWQQRKVGEDDRKVVPMPVPYAPASDTSTR